MFFRKFVHSLMIALVSVTLMTIDVSLTATALAQSGSANPSISEDHQNFQNAVQETGQQNQQEPQQQNQEEESGVTNVDGVATTIATNSDGEQVQTTSTSTEGTADQLQTADFLTLVTMLAMGLIAATLVRYQPTTLDMWIAIAGGVIYIGGEIMAIFSAQEEITDKDFTVTNNPAAEGSGNAQQEAIQKEIQAYESIKDASETKFMLQTASAVAFAAAAVAAYMGEMKWQTAIASCMGAATAVTGPLATATGQVQCLPAATTLIKTLVTQESIMGTPSPSCIKFAELQAMLTVKQGAMAVCPLLQPCQAESVVQALEATCGVIPVASVQKGTEGMKFVQGFESIHHPLDEYLAVQSYLEVDPRVELVLPDLNRIVFSGHSLVGDVLNPPSELDMMIETFEQEIDRGFSLIPKAHAGLMSSLGLGGAVIGILAGVMGTSAPFLDNFMATPINRAVVYGVMAAAAGAGAAVTSGVGSSAEDNIEKLQELLKGFNSNATGVAGVGNNGQDPSNGRDQTIRNFNGDINRIGANNLNSVPLTADPSQNVACIDPPKNPNGAPTAGGCTDIENQIQSANGLAGLGSTFGNFATSAGQIANGIQGNNNISGATLGSASELANNSALARRGLDKAKQNLNDILKKRGKKEIDFASKENQLFNGLRRAVQKRLKRDGTNSGALLGGLGNNNLLPSDPKKLSEAALKGESKKAAAAVKQAALPNFKVPEFGDPFDFGADGAPKAEEMLSDVDEATQDNTVVEDIVKDEGANIFEIISIRYLKTGVKRLTGRE